MTTGVTPCEVQPQATAGARTVRDVSPHRSGNLVAKNDAKGSEIEAIGGKFDTEDLAAIGSFEDALKLAVDTLGEENIARASAEIGDGFKLLETKDQLIGVPMILLTWDFSIGDFGEFVSIRLVTKDGGKFIVNDGSTGIRDQLIQYTAKKGRKGGLVCDKGLRRSDYEYTDEKGQKSKAQTYYLDTSA